MRQTTRRGSEELHKEGEVQQAIAIQVQLLDLCLFAEEYTRTNGEEGEKDSKLGIGNHVEQIVYVGSNK